MRYEILQPMRFVVDFGPDTEVLPEGDTVEGLRKDQLEQVDARALDIQRKSHKDRGLRGAVSPFRWRGKVRFGLLGGDNADLRRLR